MKGRHRVISMQSNAEKQFKYLRSAEKYAIRKYGTAFVIQSWGF